MKSKITDPPDIDPIDALAAVNETWRRAWHIATHSWPGPNWGADHFAIEMKWSLIFLRRAGVDTSALVTEWRGNYDAYVADGGRMKYRPV